MLDTHAWIWWTAGAPELPVEVRTRIDAEDEVFVSPICCWEVAMLVEKGRIDLGRQPLSWVRLAFSKPATRLAALTPEIAVIAGQLGGGFHGDPADRLIVATARQLRAPLVTSDERIRRSGLVETVW
ncbi:MAG: type II toxin-antitoxin system VapC family toxin [Dehalococcoidia bacterium]|nr:type II toxin-antitoxin system VapC family toxin [Dehalococcoidia bacterium]